MARALPPASGMYMFYIRTAVRCCRIPLTCSQCARVALCGVKKRRCHVLYHVFGRCCAIFGGERPMLHRERRVLSAWILPGFCFTLEDPPKWSNESPSDWCDVYSLDCLLHASFPRRYPFDTRYISYLQQRTDDVQYNRAVYGLFNRM